MLINTGNKDQGCGIATGIYTECLQQFTKFTNAVNFWATDTEKDCSLLSPLVTSMGMKELMAGLFVALS